MYKNNNLHYYDWHYLYNRISEINSIYFSYNDLSNKTVCVPLADNKEYFYIDGNTANLDIRNIYSTYYEEFNKSD